MSKSTDVSWSDLADNLFLYKDNYTFYQASPFLELTRDTATCPPMLTTPDRARSGTRLLRSDVSAYPDVHSSITSTPRSFVTPPAPSLSMTNMKMVFSPSPLPISQVPSLVFPEISPPSQGSGSTPFERQFSGDFSREWNNINTQISPVVRSSDSSFSLSPILQNSDGNPSMTACVPNYPDSQDAAGRVSLLDKFMSAAADESLAVETDVHLSTLSSQDRSTPLSDLSDLTSLSSPESPDHFGRGLGLRGSTPPTSPTAQRPDNPRKSNIPYSERPPAQDLSPSPSTRSSSRTRDTDYRPAKGFTGCKRKRTSRSYDQIPTRRKKTRSAGAPQPSSTEAESHPGTLTRRPLPTNIPYHPQFSLFYLRFPVSSYLQFADGKFPLLSADSKRISGNYNEPRDALDLYTPRFVKGCGVTKVGVCPICIESPSRGGKDEAVWHSMKFSAYKVVFFIVGKGTRLSNASSYHMQYAHGISSVSARPFSPPVAFRTIERQNPTKNERAAVQEGKCHKCKKWILVESIKNIDIKVKELYWWKHAAACHQGTHIDGDDDFFLDDDIYRRARQAL